MIDIELSCKSKQSVNNQNLRSVFSRNDQSKYLDKCINYRKPLPIKQTKDDSQSTSVLNKPEMVSDIATNSSYVLYSANIPAISCGCSIGFLLTDFYEIARLNESINSVKKTICNLSKDTYISQEIPKINLFSTNNNPQLNLDRLIDRKNFLESKLSKANDMCDQKAQKKLYEIDKINLYLVATNIRKGLIKKLHDTYKYTLIDAGFLASDATLLTGMVPVSNLFYGLSKSSLIIDALAAKLCSIKKTVGDFERKCFGHNVDNKEIPKKYAEMLMQFYTRNVVDNKLANIETSEEVAFNKLIESLNIDSIKFNKLIFKPNTQKNILMSALGKIS